MAHEIEYVCSFFDVPHMAIPKPTCDDDGTNADTSRILLNRTSSWNMEEKPWVVLNHTLVVQMLRAVERLERVSRTMVFTDGVSGKYHIHTHTYKKAQTCFLSTFVLNVIKHHA